MAPHHPTLNGWRCTLLAGTSLTALAWCLTPGQAAQFGTPGYFSQLAQRQGTGSVPTAGGTMLPLSAQAQILAKRSAADLARAAQAITAAETAQALARTAAEAAASSVPDGLTAGGLVPAPGVGTDPTLWQNADLPVVTTTGGKTVVTITQTDAKAILTWMSFNVGRNTTVYFDQAAGTSASGDNAWVALNRIVDPSGVPSQILGSIRAEGSVYLINRNGIIFGGSSQVDVHGLIASALDIGELGQSTDQRNAQFLDEGLNILTGGGTNLSNQNVAFSTTGDPLTSPLEGAVTVAAGASIRTTVQGSDNPGSVMLLGPVVSNAGSIVSSAGQIILAAGRVVAFTENSQVGAGADYLGLVVQTNPSFLLQGSIYNIPPLPDFLPGMHATNTGILQTPRGNITLEGTSVINDGVLAATTSITRNGSIVIDGVNTVTFGPDAIASILPDLNGETIPQGQVSSTTLPTPYVQIQAAEIGTAGPNGEAVIGVGSLTFGNGSAIIAPGATVGLFGGQSVYFSQGSLVDVAGLTSATLPMSANFITFEPRGPEFANAPLQRSGALRGASLTFDIRLSGTTPDGLSWVGTPLANAAGYVSTEVTDNIEQLLATAGTVSVSTALGQNLTDLSKIVLQTGATIDVSGGFVTYQGGAVPTTRLVAANGAVYAMANADPNLTYIGVAGSFTENHTRWGVSATYGSPIIAGTPTTFEPGYIEGADAGAIELRADAIVAGGSLLGQVATGPHQALAGQVGTASSSIGGDSRHLQSNPQQLPSAGALIFDPATIADGSVALLEDGQSVAPQFVQIQSAPVVLPASLGPATILARNSVVTDPTDPFSGLNPADLADTMVLSTSLLNPGGFAQISVQGPTRELAGTTLAVANGGAIGIAGSSVEIQGGLVAHGGSIKLTSNGGGDASMPAGTPSIMVEAGALLDASGLWVNDTGKAVGGAGPGFINGGSISLLSDARALTPTGSKVEVDTTGSIVVDPAAALNVSSGGYVQPDGAILTARGVPEGAGGNITIETYAGGYSPDGFGRPKFPTVPDFVAGVALNPGQSIDAYGFSTGGTFTLSVGSSVLITDAVSTITTASDGTLELPSTMFSVKNPFGSFVIGSDIGSVTVAPGTVVRLRQSNYVATASVLRLPSGFDLTATTAKGAMVVPIRPLDAYQSTAVNLSLEASGSDLSYYPDAAAGSGSVVVGRSAVIQSNPGGAGGATIDLVGTYQVDMLGLILARSGTVLLDATGNTAKGAASLNGAEVANGAVYLGPNSLIDVRGSVLINHQVTQYQTGEVLPGGSVTLQADGTPDKKGSFGYVAAASGSRINMDGISAPLQFLEQTGDLVEPTTVDVASDAGELTLDTTAGVFAALVSATGGGPGAANGILTVTSTVGTTLAIREGRVALPSKFESGEVLTSLSARKGQEHFLRLSAQALDATDYDDINFGRIPLTNPNGSSGVDSVQFSGNVWLGARRAIRFYAPITTNAAFKGEQPLVTVSAPYLLFGTTLQNQNSATNRGIGTLAASGDIVVLQRGWIDSGQSYVTSAGDILVEPILNNGGQNFASGGLIVTGDLTLDANRIYPTGGAVGVLQALGIEAGANTVSRLTIESNGPASVPYSAGGSLYLLADHIVQDGTVWVPDGSIVLANSASPARFPFLGTNASPPSLENASSIVFGPGSVTSVSLGGLSLPYGGTVDGRAWYYGDDPNRTNTPLAAPPAKQISVEAATIDLQAGATIDLSGGGDLYASEFVPGNGGTRNVLSTENNYTAAAFKTGIAGNLSTDNTVTQVYAILPGYASAAAPSDIDFSTATGLGYQGVAPGLSVTLSAFGGLAGGTYTLLPAAYATLPGAYRVVVTGTSGFQPSENGMLADGSYMVSGRLGTPIAGEQSALPLEFIVQSGSVWRQYSEIDQASANAFFAALNPGSSVRLPHDAGHLILSATQSINLTGSLDNAAPSGAQSSEVDIAASDIEVISPGEAVMPGYIALNADQLSGLDAGSLLIGGSRVASSAGDVITATSASLIIANDSAHPLAGPEVLLVTQGQLGASDPNSANGLLVEPGAVIEARGGTAGTATSTVLIGYLPSSPLDPLPAVPGDGAFIGLSETGPITVLRENVPGQPKSTLTGPAGGILTLASGAVLSGTAVILDTADLGTIDPGSLIAATDLTLSAETLGLGTAPAGTGGLILSGTNLAALASVHTLELHSYAAIDLFGSLNVDQTASGSTLILDAASIASDGGAATLAASTIEMQNSAGATATEAAGTGGLTIAAQQIVIGKGTLILDGFGRVALQASAQLDGSETGGLDAGAAAVTVTTPQLVAEADSDTALVSTGSMTLLSGGTPSTAAGTALGGALTVTGGTLSVDTAIVATAGDITLDATAGDLALGAAARLVADGAARGFFDVVRYGPGGNVDLISATGNVTAAAGSQVDVAGAVGGGAAGTLTVDAPAGAAILGGTLTGSSADGVGALFVLHQLQGASLDALAASLATGGFHDAVTIETQTGNLDLTSGTLRAATVSLTADAGAITIGSAATVDASGDRGGAISLFGATGVDVEGRLLAVGSNPTRAGGTVDIGTSGTFAGTYNGTYGYENDSSAGPVTIGSGAVIDVSGGTIDGLTGGIVHIRTPLLENGTINLTAVSGARIIGAHDLIVEAYATWSTGDSTTGATHFDGVVDPAGWYDDTGALVAGTDQNGNTIAAGSVLKPGQYFTPNKANGDHVGFYQQTLMGFVQGFSVTPSGSTAALTGAEFQPGIALVNPSTTVQSGNITVASNWNLGAGGYDQTGNVALFYRTGGGQPGDLTLRAANNVIVNASISDGFFQPFNFLDSRYLTLVKSVYLTLAPGGNSTQGFYVEPLVPPSAPYDTTDSTYNANVGLYYKAYRATYSVAWSSYDALSQQLYFVNGQLPPVPAGTVLPTPPPPPVYANPASYGASTQSYTAYVSYFGSVYGPAYTAYLSALGAACASCALPQPPAALQAPPPFGTTIGSPTGSFSLSNPVGFYGANGPANNPTGSDPNPVLSADLFPLGSLGAPASWSIALVGGSETGSPNPLALLPVTQFATGSGSVTLNGHNIFTSQLSSLVGLVPVIVRTGTGSIDIAAAYDFALTDSLAPGAVYTAGRNSPALPSAGYVSVDGGSALNGPDSIAANTPSINGLGDLGSGTGSTTIGNPAGFDAPDFGSAIVLTAPTLFAVTEPAWPEAGGHVAISAQHDVVGVQDIPTNAVYSTSSAGYMTQFWSAWLLTRSYGVPSSSGNSQTNFDANQGVFNPNASHHVGSGQFTDQNDGQTTWWINFGSFDQGVAALGGGDVTVTAGRDIVDFAASTVTTGRVSGGLSASALPRLTVTGGGDLTVMAGGDIVSGAFYAASGTGKVSAAGSIIADPNWTYTYSDTATHAASSVTVDPATIIGVGDTQMTVSARGDVNIGDVVNPTEVNSQVVLTVGDSYITAHGGASSLGLTGSASPWVFQGGQFNTMGPNSAVTIDSAGGDILLDSLPQQAADGRNRLYTLSQRLMPATVEVTALSGSVDVLSNFNMVNSSGGTLDIVAEQNVRLAAPDDSVGIDSTESIASPASVAAGIATYQTQRTQTISTLFPIPGLVDSQFDPENPVAGLNAVGAQYVLLHADGSSLSHIYAATGDITNGPVSGTAAATVVPATSLPMPLLTDESIAIRAGRDVRDLQLYAQNPAATDVTTVGAGRDIIYDLPASNPLLSNGSNGANLIEQSGPGSLVVTAGRNLGPFPADFDTGPSGIETTGNVAWITGYEDPLLSTKGASVYAFAGVAPGIDDAAVIADYIAPASIATAPHNYLPELVTYFAQTLGIPGLTRAEAWTRFETLSPDAQNAFVDQVFFAELQATQPAAGTPTYSRGYLMVNTMFPGKDGYTQNDVSGGSNGSNNPVETGNIDLRSATIQTRHGGDIFVFAPGGNVLLGSSAARAVYNLPGLTGILTFQGGSINLFADQSITVNQSRILTEEGGNVLVWSSNGDILAGIGAKTSADFPPYTVLFDNDAVEQLDPAGLVTGAGIGALVTLAGQDPADSNAYLFAPRGTVDAGDAGIRVAGNLVVAALHVANASNISVGGSAVGVPTAPSVNIGALSSAGAVAANAGRSADDQGLGGNAQDRQAPSIIIVDLVGFGGS